jgi:hypothetical protein
MPETWKSIVGYEGLYEVSSVGRVKSLARTTVTGQYKEERILKPWSKNTILGNYVSVALSKDGASKKHLVHRLVGKAFLIPQDGCAEINHKNKIRDDNRVDNLEWVTAKRNYDHSFEMGRNHPRSRRVVVSKDGVVHTFEQCKMADAFLNVCKGSVSNALGRYKRVRGWEVGFL